MTFDEWFKEVELFSTREERFFNDLDHHNSNSKGSYQRMASWLEAAYNAGSTSHVQSVDVND
ncbi:MAG: hypothetical protein EB127_15385 [Alphaproteobacteria bacterium]|nr:hypothetical protein [Alphaproteobacteria bacterium]